jgi:hypothetical protein
VMRVRIDGKEYRLEGQLTLGEQQVFKQVGGIRLGELEDAMTNGDPDTLVALVIIMRRRAGETCTIEDAQSVTALEFIDEPTTVVDAGPPPVPVADSPPSEHGVTALPQRVETTPNDSGLPSSRTVSA